MLLRSIAHPQAIEHRNSFNSAKPSEEANDCYVNGDRSLSRYATLGVRALQRTNSQSCISMIDRTLCAIECTQERKSCDLLIGHSPSFPHHF